MSLDQFLSSSCKPKEVEARCADPGCRKIIKGIKYTLTIKGKKEDYCQSCAKKKLCPLENSEQSL